MYRKMCLYRRLLHGKSSFQWLVQKPLISSSFLICHYVSKKVHHFIGKGEHDITVASLIFSYFQHYVVSTSPNSAYNLNSVSTAMHSKSAFIWPCTNSWNHTTRRIFANTFKHHQSVTKIICNWVDVSGVRISRRKGAAVLFCHHQFEIKVGKTKKNIL